MESATPVALLLAAIFGGGGVGALVQLFRYRTDRDSAVALGAEAAVQSLTLALARADTRSVQAETRSVQAEERAIKLENQIITLKEEIISLRDMIGTLRRGMSSTQRSSEALTENLAVTNTKLNQVIKEQENITTHTPPHGTPTTQ